MIDCCGRYPCLVLLKAGETHPWNGVGLEEKLVFHMV